MPWRDLLKIHPAADLFPLLSESGLRELAEDIKVNGLVEPIVGWASSEGQFLLDGRNRLDALALLGLLYETDDHHVGVKKWTGKQWSDQPGGRLGYECEFRNFYDGDPYAIALSLNVHRRHLTAEQRRELIAKVLKAKPELSNVTVAKQVKADDKTVAKVRRELEATSEIPRLEKTVGTDGKSRPARAKAENHEPNPEISAERRKQEYVAAERSVVKFPVSAALQEEWRAAEHAFENLTRHTPQQVARAISPDKAAVVTEFTNFFTDLAALLKPDAKPAFTDEPPAAASPLNGQTL